jgi:hypothetical protein
MISKRSCLPPSRACLPNASTFRVQQLDTEHLEVAASSKDTRCSFSIYGKSYDSYLTLLISASLLHLHFHLRVRIICRDLLFAFFEQST